MAHLLLPTHRSFRFAPSRTSLCLAALGLLTGLGSACVISVNEDWDGDPEACYEAYDDCLDDAFPFGPHAVDACEALLDNCLESCDKGETGGDGDAGADGGSGDGDTPGDGDGDTPGDGDGDTPGDGDGDNPPHAGDGDGDNPPRAGDGDGDGDNPPRAGDGDGDGDGPDPACFELHAACVAEAMTLQDIEACEALFDNCIDPGPCDDPECEPGCPQAELDACVSNYADCAANALTAEDVLVCEGMFDACIAQFDVELCLPGYDEELVLVCLEQHELCIACADGADEIAACKVTFDNCLEA